jgi:hypothetical protein
VSGPLRRGPTELYLLFGAYLLGLLLQNKDGDIAFLGKVVELYQTPRATSQKRTLFIVTVISTSNFKQNISGFSNIIIRAVP